MNFNSNVLIDRDKAELVRHYMDDEPTCEKEALVDDYIGFIAVFPNGFDIFLLCCGIGCYDPANSVNTAWGEAVLFKYGREITLEKMEGSDEFFSPTTLSDGDGNTYTIHPIICK